MSALRSSATSDGPILFYDGKCGLCARSVQWALEHDRKEVMRFAPLQGTTYAALDVPDKPPQMDSLVLCDADGLHVRSDGVLRILRIVGGGWRLLGAIARIVPRFVRDAVYRWVARHRESLGSASACLVPTPAARERFLP
jgi:predicted DCC family thiol-disulfide oxidoreductase YuxK